MWGYNEDVVVAVGEVGGFGVFAGRFWLFAMGGRGFGVAHLGSRWEVVGRAMIDRDRCSVAETRRFKLYSGSDLVLRIYRRKGRTRVSNEGIDLMFTVTSGGH